MKVLFAVNNENVSEAIIKKYQKDYKEIISYKNVYYFNAIIKEIQRDKTYDRIVISEDLEPFANNNYDTIDKFLFEKLDNISDEATDSNDKDIQIILICTDRRTKSDSILVKLFGIGIYSAIIGPDRSVEEVCRLINSPRTKKEAKVYYRIDAEDVIYKAENDTDVNENEIQNILRHYKQLGKNEEKYIESFNNIAAQYTDAQLRIIIKFLPLNVKAVLEANSPKYQEIVTFGDKQYKTRNTATINEEYRTNKETKREKTPSSEDLKIEAIEKRVNNPLTGKPIIIPSVSKKARQIESISSDETRNVSNVSETEENEENSLDEQFEDIMSEPQETDSNTQNEQMPPVLPLGEESNEPKRGRGRPKKVEENLEQPFEPKVKKGRGRPKKNQEESVNLYTISEELESEEETADDSFEPISKIGHDEENQGVVLPGFEQEEQYDDTDDFESILDKHEKRFNDQTDTAAEMYNQDVESNQVEKVNSYFGINSSHDVNSLITKDKKIVSFVGTTKNGTSFMVNNLAILLASMGVNTAILDMTENRNSYYIFTKNEEELRKVASQSFEKLKQGRAEGIKVNKNLSVYTALPGEEKDISNADGILSTLVNNYSLVLIDCDFSTPKEYFAASQEIYLVQTMDVLTIQPLTAFLRDLKNTGVLDQEKLRVVINKTAKVRGLSDKVILGGMAFYNDPSMSFMTELFNKDRIRFVGIPFDLDVYTRYLEALVNCNVVISGYPKAFLAKLKELGNMVYPLLNKQSYKVKPMDYSQNTFSANMNNTLDQMKKKY
jgi:hypothetical protein